MKPLSSVASNVQASTTLALDSLYKEMKANGVDVLGFAAGEPDFPTPDHIKLAAVEAIIHNETRYTPASGTMALKIAICDRLKADLGLHYEPPQIVCSSGAKHCVYIALRTLVDEGDEVIVPAPYWVSYVELVKMVGGTPVAVLATEEVCIMILLLRRPIAAIYDFDAETTQMLMLSLGVFAFTLIPRMASYAVQSGILRAGGDTFFCLVVDLLCFVVF